MPTVTFLGPLPTRRRPDCAAAWERRKPTQVSQAWLNQWRNRVSDPKYFLIEGDEGETVDFNDDGIPDSGWTKKDISAWITENGGKVVGYNTKNKLLGIVDTILNPPAPEPVVEEPIVEEPVVEEPVVEEPVTEEVVEEVVEDTIVEDPIVETDGVEE